jgi:DNA polymerase
VKKRSTFCFADSETRSPADVTIVGAYKMAAHPQTDVTVWGWCFEQGYGHVWSPDWAWSGDNSAIDEVLEHVERELFLVAWHSGFDRTIWNAVMVPKYGWPHLHLEQVLCAQAQAEANNLPGKLEKAAEAAGAQHKKQRSGSRLMTKFARGTRGDWPASYRATDGDMSAWRSYCMHDCLSMRDVWNRCRPLTREEWAEFHASERINDRGAAVDVAFALAAAQYAQAEFKDINGQLAELTGDPAITVTNHPRKARWLHDHLWPSEELQALTERPARQKEIWEKDPETGEKVVTGVEEVERFGADRATREALLELLVQDPYGDLFPRDLHRQVVQFIELVEAGNSAAARKFGAIANMQVDGRVYGQYSFNGAGQTGRFSSRGIQVHNLTNQPVSKEDPDRALDAIDGVMARMSPEALAKEFGLPVSRLLARLVRPTFIAPDGCELVWADYDQVEARKLPWLANSRAADAYLEVFRRGEDVYEDAARKIVGADRFIGKVATLALGFGGSVGAFQNMARTYGLAVTDDEALRIVKDWRRGNAWAREFWFELWDAVTAAWRHQGQWYAAGRVRYLFHPGLLDGTMICELPSGRWIIYPGFRHEEIEVEEDGKTARRWRTSFMKGFGGGSARVDLWYGMLAENITQASAADMLRLAIVRLQDSLVLHTHDEVVGECAIDDVEDYTAHVVEEMTRLPDWAEGLPLSVSAEHGPYYTK